MNKKELAIIIQNLKEGKIFYSQDRDYSDSGDIFATVIRHNENQNNLLLELYNLTGNGNYCKSSKPLNEQALENYIGQDFSEALNKMREKIFFDSIK